MGFEQEPPKSQALGDLFPEFSWLRLLLRPEVVHVGSLGNTRPGTSERQTGRWAYIWAPLRKLIRTQNLAPTTQWRERRHG